MLANKPPIVHSLKSIFRLSLFSLSDALDSSSVDRVLCSISPPSCDVADILIELAMVFVNESQVKEFEEGDGWQRHPTRPNNSDVSTRDRQHLS